MRRFLLSLSVLLSAVATKAQLLSWTPQYANDNSTISITVDATKGNQGLLGYTGNVYMHLGVITNLSTGPSDWKYVPTTWGTTTAPIATSLGNNKWLFTLTNPRAYFNSAAGGVPAGETILRVVMLFRDATGAKVQRNTDGSDMYVPIYPAGGNHIQFTLPFIQPTYNISHEPITATVGQQVPAKAKASTAAGTLKMYFNGNLITGPLTSVDSISGNPTITTTGNQQIVAELIVGGVSYYDTVKFYVTPVTVVAALPAGVKEGINYGNDCSTVTLVLYAPGKTSVAAIGDFPGSNWLPQAQYQMNKTPDGNYFWITITGLTSGTEYAYQYLVDNSIYIADPYTEKVLDPWNDQYIPAATYPNLKPYPNNSNVSAGQNGLVGVLQPCAPAYNWQVTNFTKPDKKNLITYEMLVRDFGDVTANNNYQLLIDTFSYFKRLGVNAIELMPVNEFTGNQSWGYNPEFYCALDKAYGTKDKFKEFIDLCHTNGIAVILDVVYNHMDAYNAPQGKLYWDAANGRPAVNNPWLNIAAPHPYGVFQDLNHTSTATQYLVERSLKYWLTEYKVDGFRFDLAKGFTQKCTQTSAMCSTVSGSVEDYDASRVANLERYYDSIVPAFPNTYMILEFLGTQRQEEQEYANHGFLLWGNNNSTYNQATMGFSSNSDFSKVVYSSSQEGFTVPAEMGYMESHDEERNMYRNITFGNISGSYNVKNLDTALIRQAAAAAVFFTVPGPKMIWQFGERGYDIPLNYGGSNVSNKPPHWEYMSDPHRLNLWNAFAKLINLRLSNPAVFNNTTFSYDFYDNGGLFRRMQIADPSGTGVKVTVVANLDVTAQTRTINFQSTGTWSNYLSDGMLIGQSGINGSTGSSFNITTTSQSITLQPGEYHVYLQQAACTTALPTATTPVSYCQNAASIPLSATGTNLLWYTTSTGGTGSSTAPTPSTAAAGVITYYVSQTIGCEGSRLPVTVNINPTPTAPVATITAPTCTVATGSILVTAPVGNYTYSFDNGTSYQSASLSGNLSPGTYAVIVKSAAGCISPVTNVTINQPPAIPAAPVVASPVSFCQNSTATALSATGTNLLWYTTATGGIGSSTAPVPSTLTAGSTTYYVSQTNVCESPRSSVVVNIIAAPNAPTVSSPVNYCQGSVATALTATGINLLWYTTATGGSSSSIAPTPVTTTVGTTVYYVSQTVNTCESQRASISVNITATTAAPTVISPVTYCQNTTAAALTATGTALLWYTSASGGTGSSSAPVPATGTAGSVTYYVSQTQSCGESPRAAIVVNVNATPPLPSVSTPVNYCQNVTATALSATGSGLLWYNSQTGGTGNASAPTPSTSAVGSNTYYVSQTVNGCEGPRNNIIVNVLSIPSAPVVTSPVTYCQNTTAAPLSATGTNLLWYANASGGVGSSSAPTPSTSVAGTTNYYVSQTSNTCEGPRATIIVTINPATPAPVVTSPVNYCQNAPAVALTATGNSLLWYTAATGGIGSSTAPTPATSTVGVTVYYVSQTTGCGEGPKATITVNTNAIPVAPTVSSPLGYCQQVTAPALTATGSSLLWYTTATGGTGSATAPTPSTLSAGSTDYYVSQTITGCEGPRALITVNITAASAVPVVNTPIAYCQNSATNILSATGNNLLWYNSATGGTGVTTAPTPSSNTAGSTIYYVTQNTNTCESPRVGITVDITAIPAAPVVTADINYLQHATATALSASGTNLLWYTSATGGVGSAAAPIPSTDIIGATTYYVSQSVNTCESPRSAITVNVFSYNFINTHQHDGITIKMISPAPVIGSDAIIDYTVPDNGTVSMVLYNSFGQQLAVLFNTGQSAGHYQLNITNQFNMLPGGYYFIYLQQNNKRDYIKFVKK